MEASERFDRNARANGVLIDTNLFVLLIVGSVNRDRIPLFKRTSNYRPEDWDLLTGVLEQIPRRLTLAHVLAEVNTLTDLKGSEGEIARKTLAQAISFMEELSFRSGDVCASPYYVRLGLTDAAIEFAAIESGCSIITNDSALHVALLEQGISVLKFDDLRAML